MLRVLICGIYGNWEKWGGDPRCPRTAAGIPLLLWFVLVPNTRSSRLCGVGIWLLHLLPTASPPSRGAPTPSSLPWVTGSATGEHGSGEPRWRTPLENSDSSPAASSPAASHCLMSTKYFHVANYLVRLCCCGQRWRRENPPRAGLAPREQGEPRLGLPRAEHPHPHHAPRHPPAPSPWGRRHQQPPNDVPTSPVTFPWPQRDTDGYSGKASPSQDLNWPLRDLEKALEPPFPRRRWFGVRPVGATFWHGENPEQHHRRADLRPSQPGPSLLPSHPRAGFPARALSPGWNGCCDHPHKTIPAGRSREPRFSHLRP